MRGLSCPIHSHFRDACVPKDDSKSDIIFMKCTTPLCDTVLSRAWDAGRASLASDERRQVHGPP